MKKILLVLFAVTLLVMSFPIPFACSIPTPEEATEMPDLSGVDPGSPEWVEAQEQVDAKAKNRDINNTTEDDDSQRGSYYDKEYYQIFNEERWNIVMFWYNAMSILSGGFLVAVVVKSGYKYMMSAANPGLKASFTEDLQRCIVAMAILALAPVFIKVLIGVNDGFVAFFANIVNHVTTSPTGAPVSQITPASIFEKIIAAPFEVILTVINKIFGLSSVDMLIFNGSVDMLSETGRIDTGNVFANVLLKITMVGFDVYFNAIYTIRRWVVTAIFTATPIIVWLWAFTGERQVIEIWAAEIFQTVFIQTAHALTLGVCLTILSPKNIGGVVNGLWLSEGISNIAVWIASLGGAVCVLIVVLVGYRIMTAGNEKEASEARLSLGKALVGLSILGSAVLIAGYLTYMLSGHWY